MPRYFFDIVDGSTTYDTVGTELTNDTAVEDLTMKTLADMVRNQIVALHRSPMAVVVRNETGEELYRATLSLHAGWSADPRR